MRRKTIKKMLAVLLSLTMVISSSIVSFATTETNQGCVSADETAVTMNEDSSSRFDEFTDFIEEIDDAELGESAEELIQEETAAEMCDNLLDDCDNVEEIDEAVFDEPEEEVEPGNYLLLTSDEGITIINNDTNEYTSVAINEDGNVNVEMVEFNQDNEMVKNNATVEILDEDVVEGQGWKSVVKETYENKYWYQNSDTGKYVRIGCDARYKINYNSLSNSKADNVRTYRSKVRATKDKWAAFKKACSNAGVSGTAVVVALVASFGAAPETFGASLLIGVVVGLAAGVTWNEAEKIVTNYKGTRNAYKKVQSTYKTIRKYGTKY